MRESTVVLAVMLLLIGCSAENQQPEFITLFDGQSLKGWEGDESIFRIVDGAIVGGTLDAPIPQRNYLCTTREFSDFELRFTAKVEGAPNAGVHFRSHRISGTNEVGGYQADIGSIPGRFIPFFSDVTDIDTSQAYPLWGSLLDEFRPEPGRYPNPDRPFRLIALADRDVVESAMSDGDWNELTIIAVGPRIEIRLNGVRTIEFVESEDLVQDGHICLQVHNGPPSMVWYKDIMIREISER